MIFSVKRYSDHGEFRLENNLNGNVFNFSCAYHDALNCAFSADAGFCKVLRYNHATKGWAVEVHHKSGAHKSWQKTFNSGRASLHMFNELCAALLRCSITSPTASDVATYVAETFNLELV